jgi:hypothetical protein
MAENLSLVSYVTLLLLYMQYKIVYFSLPNGAWIFYWTFRHVSDKGMGVNNHNNHKETSDKGMGANNHNNHKETSDKGMGANNYNNHKETSIQHKG